MTDITKIAVTGATGRMGRLVQDVVGSADNLELVAAIHRGVPLEEAAGADVILDVTILDESRRVVEFGLARRIPVVVGTSGWSQDLIAQVAPAPDAGTLVIVPNFSVASALSTKLAAMAAPFFDAAEIIEAHHAGKVDSPSGTAVAAAELIAAAHGAPLVAPHPEQPARGQSVAGIPVHALRLPGVVARQDVIFGGTGETLTLTHVTTSDESYRAGILHAIDYAGSHPGLTVGLGQILGLD